MKAKEKSKLSSESIVRQIKRMTRRKFSAEEKIRIVLTGLRGEESITDHCRKEGKGYAVFICQIPRLIDDIFINSIFLF